MSSDTILGQMFDEYRMGLPLGKKGMARVYRAIDTKLCRYCAKLRTIRAYAKRFQCEAGSCTLSDCGAAL